MQSDPPRELIFSGGDPLLLEDASWERLLDTVRGIAGIRRVRIHSRVPTVLPGRITDALLDLIRFRSGKATILVLHVNHPREVDAEVAATLARIVDRGIPVLAQSVLLKEVNDSYPVLFELYERLISLRILPYYLHQLDRVAGAAPFEVPELRGREILEQLRDTLPGYAVPRYVREIPGKPSKTELHTAPSPHTPDSAKVSPQLPSTIKGPQVEPILRVDR